jgi:hypothetical protein
VARHTAGVWTAGGEVTGGRPRAPGPPVAAAALLLVALVAACGDDDDRGVEVPVAAAGDVYVPGPVEGHPIEAVTRVRVGDPVYDRLHGTGPLVVTEVDRAVVGVVTVPVATVEAAWGATPGALDPDERMPEIAGRPTVATLGDRIAAPRPAETIGWRVDDATMAAAASSELDLVGLVAVAERVGVDGDGDVTVPGAEIGRIPPVWNAPQPAVRVRYGADEVVVHTATPSVQAAYRALLHDDPATTIEPLTEPRCCQPEILAPLRTVDIGERTGVLGTLTSTTRVLVVDGDPGAVLFAEVGLGVADDATLLAIADSLTVVAEPDVDDRLAELGPSPDDTAAAAGDGGGGRLTAAPAARPAPGSAQPHPPAWHAATVGAHVDTRRRRRCRVVGHHGRGARL